MQVDSKFVTKYLWLTSKDINKFSFRQRWFIDNAYYIVNKISNYDPTKSDSILCELIKLLESNVFSPSQVLIATEPNITAGATITRQVNNTSLRLGTNSNNYGTNSILVGNNSRIGVNKSNNLIIGDNVNSEEDNIVYLNGSVIPTINAHIQQ